MTQYVLWMLICFLITLVVVLAASKRLTIIPTNKFTNMVEYGYEFVKKDMGESAIGHGYKKHLPFLATLFFFILISNFVGLIPGCKTPTGSIIGSAIQGAGVGVGSISIAWMLFLFAMYALEVLVAFLQAYVFTILSAVYIGLATSDH